MLGGGGFVAGPWSSRRRARIPTALTEADAHLGLANRLAAPFAAPRLPRVPDRGAGRPPKYRVTGRPIPPALRDRRAPEARRRFELPEEGAAVARLRRLAGARRLNELALDAFGAEGPRVLHLCR